jgi:hypothetical protein
LGDSFFDELKSKINKNCNTYKKEELYNKLDINNKVGEFRSLLQLKLLRIQLVFLMKLTFPETRLEP